MLIKDINNKRKKEKITQEQIAELLSDITGKNYFQPGVSKLFSNDSKASIEEMIVLSKIIEYPIGEKLSKEYIEEYVKELIKGLNDDC